MSEQIFKIIYEDDYILILDKRQPFLSQKGDESEKESLVELLGRTLKSPVFPVHRLDREVLGLMVYAKTESAAENLSHQFRKRAVKKVYEVEVHGRVARENETVVHYLRKNKKNNYVTVFPRPTPQAKRAELSYHVKRRSDKSSLISVELKTGRSHQIRAQLAKLGHPIRGDQRYSRREEDAGLPIQLKSVMLGFYHPQSGEFHRWEVDGLSFRS